MKTELSAEDRTEFAELRELCERTARRRVAIVKKLATELCIRAKVKERCAKLESELALPAKAARAQEEMHGRKLQLVLLQRTIEGSEAKAVTLAEEAATILAFGVSELHRTFGEDAPESVALLNEPAPENAPEKPLQQLAEILTEVLGDRDERAAAEHHVKLARRMKEYREAAKAQSAAPLPSGRAKQEALAVLKARAAGATQAYRGK